MRVLMLFLLLNTAFASTELEFDFIFKGTINDSLYQSFVKTGNETHFFNKRVVFFKIVSGGGYITSGIQIMDTFDALKSRMRPVKIICYVEKAMSMAFAILQMCDERIAYPKAKFMQHTANIPIKSAMGIPPDSVFALALNDMMHKVEASRLKISLKEWVDLISTGKDYHFGNKRALEIGAIDSILEVE